MTEFPRYPCWRYHKDLPAGRIFQDQAEIDAAGEGWVDTPAKLQPAEPAGAAEAPAAEPAKKRGRAAGKDLA